MTQCIQTPFARNPVIFILTYIILQLLALLLQYLKLRSSDTELVKSTSTSVTALEEPYIKATNAIWRRIK